MEAGGGRGGGSGCNTTYLGFKDPFGCPREMDLKEARIDLGDQFAVAAVWAGTAVCSQ